MAATYIISKDFELWFCVDGRFIAHQDIVVLLKRIGLLGFLFHHDFTVEHTCWLPIVNAFIFLVAFRIGMGMMHQGMMIDQLLAFHEGNAFHGGLNRLVFVIKMQVVANKLTPKRKGMHFGMRMLFLVYIGTIDQRCILMVVLNFIVIYLCALMGKNFRYHIGQYGGIGQALVSFNDLHFALGFHHNQIAGL